MAAPLRGISIPNRDGGRARQEEGKRKEKTRKKTPAKTFSEYNLELATLNNLPAALRAAGAQR